MFGSCNSCRSVRPVPPTRAATFLGENAVSSGLFTSTSQVSRVYSSEGNFHNCALELLSTNVDLGTLRSLIMKFAFFLLWVLILKMYLFWLGQSTAQNSYEENGFCLYSHFGRCMSIFGERLDGWTVLIRADSCQVTGLQGRVLGCLSPSGRCPEILLLVCQQEKLSSLIKTFKTLRVRKFCSGRDGEICSWRCHLRSHRIPGFDYGTKL